MTPLAAVLGHLETPDMQDVVLEESVRRKQIAIAMREARRLRRVIGDLLNTARYEAGGVQLDVEEISTAALFQQIRLRHEQECRTRELPSIPS
jgi:signal transduction histidine kinase